MEMEKHKWRKLTQGELGTINAQSLNNATFLDWLVLGPSEGVRYSTERGWENFDRALDDLWGPMPEAITNVDEAKAYVTALYRMKGE